MKNIWAIVPVKPLNRSKSRLSTVLNIKQREVLSREMLERTLGILKQVEKISDILIVSRDTAALKQIRQFGVQTLQESGAPELNDSLTRATQVVGSWNASAVLIVASDIPLLETRDIEGVIGLAEYSPAVVIATDRHRDGTNVMLVSPPGLIPYRYGPGSLYCHVEEARAAGIEPVYFNSPTIELDVDTPEDLKLYRRMLAEREINEPAWFGNT
ncbi:MAG: 2-phospho-L-lactate guanylyltransferase [Anaerolineae bacterium]|nr:2-phospho-L-lactate guanylyltransferase [Anaerolineae bacterium]